MAVPKRRSSKSKIRMRKKSHRISLKLVKACPECGAPQQSHRACPSCGYYRGRQTVMVRTE